MSSEDDHVEVLIAEIQARPALWNTKLQAYKNKNVRDRLLTEVAQILGIYKETVAARWKNKKDKYRRELQKIPVSHSGDAAKTYKSTWPYFDMMSFLKDQVTPALKYGNSPTLEQSQEDVMHSDIEDDRTDTQLAIDPCVVVSPPSISTASTHSQEERPSSVSASTTVTASTTVSQKGKDNRKRLCDVRDGKFLEIENKKLLLLAQNLKHDDAMPDSEEFNFFKSLIPYLGKFKQIQKLRVRNKIQQVILH
ncbi:hypothetical protein JTB14_006041 [Gonioctena quinquepunctata]|nr:hypothetical protein JTB14_006041 [Gonioctena quinquepunctata]